MSNGLLKLFQKPVTALVKQNNFVFKNGCLNKIIIHDTYNHFRNLNELNFIEKKYKTYDQVLNYFVNFAPVSDYFNNYSEEVKIIAYSLKDYNVETLPGILFSKNFEILALKNEMLKLDENITQVMLIDIEKLKLDLKI
jgi:hypothetical protein